jgi:hypothetical protein
MILSLAACSAGEDGEVISQDLVSAEGSFEQEKTEAVIQNEIVESAEKTVDEKAAENVSLKPEGAVTESKIDSSIQPQLNEDELITGEGAGSDDSVEPVVEKAKSPEIISQPESVAVNETFNVLLQVVAVGGELSYQWRKDGVLIPGAQSSSFVISDVTVLDSGSYDVVVSSESEQSISLVAEVIVIPAAPDIEEVSIVSHPEDVMLDEGLDIELSINAQGGGELSYQWYKDGIALDGENSSVLSVTDAALEDAGLYYVEVSNSAGGVVSNSAQVQVNELVVLKSLLLEWGIPEQRADGSSLELYEIDAYRISYGTDSANLSEMIVIDNASDTEFQLHDLPSGTYYFAISTVDIDGVQGDYSQLVSITI